MITIDVTTIWPILIISIFGMLVLLWDVFDKSERKQGAMLISTVGLLLTGSKLWTMWDMEYVGFAGSIVADNFAILFQGILVIVALLSVMLSDRYIRTKNINHGEYYALLLFSTSGAMLMATSRELITIFVGLEVLSIALYVLSGFARTEPKSEESAMKYFLLGAFSSGFFLYGIAMVYGGIGTTRLDTIPFAGAQMLSSPYAVAGFALLLVGLAFKAAIVPFHSWTPDVYEGAPTTVTAFMSAAAKAGAFAAFIRIAVAFLPATFFFHTVLWVLAAATMIVGNVIAVQQTNVKRMLAYSSIAHAGYLLVGLLAQTREGYGAILFYVLAYTLMNLGAFGVLIWLARRGQDYNTIDDLRGLGRANPVAAAFMAIFMLSLGGIPPTVGFMGKLYLFLAAIHSNLNGLAYLGLLASVVGAFYYLRIIWSMYFDTAKGEFPTDTWSYSPWASVALVICAIGSVVFGVLPSGLYDTSKSGGDSIAMVRGLNVETAVPPTVRIPVAAVKLPVVAKAVAGR